MLMMWADLIPPLYMTSILDVEFFPKWLTVLHRWLSDTADYSEVKYVYSSDPDTRVSSCFAPSKKQESVGKIKPVEKEVRWQQIR